MRAHGLPRPTEQLPDFLAALRGEKPSLVTAEQARNAVAFIEAVYESGRTGRPVQPAPVDLSA
ncbi:Gfo/Idh/MocA family oxidoreductase [Pseudactinotalea sp. Z1748]|uniref:Gfo/Idh/MocA family oxidoreductase n=1 Tax=Pseudactinotalea sp. Z1748 TaxID=3413027 RepID=UPI003C7C9745